MATDGSFVYIAGSVFREKRSSVDGTLVWETLGSGSAENIVLGPPYLYIVGASGGKWAVEKRDLFDGALDMTFDGCGTALGPAAGSLAASIAIDPLFIYVAGWDQTPGPNDRQWRLEKRNR